MISASLTERLKAQGLDPVALTDLIKGALAEDRAGEDKTTLATISADQTSTANLRSRKTGVLAGVNVAAAVFEIAGITKIEIVKRCGETVAPGETIFTVSGKTRAILSAERVALNLISHLSGIATTTKIWVKEIEGTGAVIRDVSSLAAATITYATPIVSTIAGVIFLSEGLHWYQPIGAALILVGVGLVQGIRLNWLWSRRGDLNP